MFSQRLSEKTPLAIDHVLKRKEILTAAKRTLIKFLVMCSLEHSATRFIAILSVQLFDDTEIDRPLRLFSDVCNFPQYRN